MSERWVEVAGSQGKYWVSTAGRIYNANRRTFLGGTTRAKGYAQVRLRFPGQKTRTFLVHRLVAHAFHGPPPEGHVVNHLNGVKRDNRSSNLAWVTPKENAQHASRMGLLRSYFTKGEGNFKAKLTEGRVREIRALHKQGEGYSSLARRCGVSPTTVMRVLTRRNWAHVA